VGLGRKETPDPRVMTVQPLPFPGRRATRVLPFKALKVSPFKVPRGIQYRDRKGTRARVSRVLKAIPSKAHKEIKAIVCRALKATREMRVMSPGLRVMTEARGLKGHRETLAAAYSTSASERTQAG